MTFSPEVELNFKLIGVVHVEKAVDNYQVESWKTDLCMVINIYDRVQYWYFNSMFLHLLVRNVPPPTPSIHKTTSNPFQFNQPAQFQPAAPSYITQEMGDCFDMFVCGCSDIGLLLFISLVKIWKFVLEQ